jgi:hypothetical protein
MKKTLTLILLLISFIASGQSDKDKTLELRARNLHKAITKNDKAGWKKYMTENFTRALIDRPMRAKLVTSEDDNTSSNAASNTENPMEVKLAMFERLHEDFGKGKISSVKVDGHKVEMIVTTGGGMTGVFRLDSEPNTPWLIDKLGIEVEANN